MFHAIPLLLFLFSIFCSLAETGRATTTSVVPDTNHVIILEKNWRLEGNNGISVEARVPGDVLTDLVEGGILDDPYLDRNFLTQPPMNHVTWTYSISLGELQASIENEGAVTWQLVAEGIKMGADIFFNNVHLGTVTDQFLRYTFTLEQKHLGIHSNNVLKIVLDPNIQVNGRFTACSGGWDWAPYSQQMDAQGKQMFTMGIVKPVYLVAIRNYAITHVVPKVYYHGPPHPREPLLHGPQGDFSIRLFIHLEFSNNNLSLVPPQLLVQSKEFGTQVVPVGRPPPNTNTTIIKVFMVAHQNNVELWWPNGMGKQPLYDIYIGVQGVQTNHLMMIRKRIGFRIANLVTFDDTNHTALAEAAAMAQGSGHHGMYFRINGAVMVARGANVIPMDQLEGRMTDEAHIHVVQSAAAAKMNMLRIWGGGMVLPDAFYDACDELGVVLYHDMMFVEEKGHGPIKIETIDKEIRHLVRSLASHPSIAIWNGCNECQVVMGTPTEIYATFVMTIVAHEDDTRSIWPSSPSKHGWKSGVYTLDSRPNGKPLATFDPDAFPMSLESHGPYLHGLSEKFPGVNGFQGGKGWVPYNNTPPKLQPVNIGVAFPSSFSSEFGATVWSSFESMAGTISRQFWSIHGNAPPDHCRHVKGNNNFCQGNNTMAQRNYPCDSHIMSYFGNQCSLDEVGVRAFQAQLYLCLMGQTLWMKGEIEKRRSQNLFGFLIWQLNENWPTGGWGLIEYGTTKGENDHSQVLGGRWKPLMHLLESSLFRDVIVACGKEEDQCYVRNDGIDTIYATVSMESWSFREIHPKSLYTFTISLEAGNILWFPLPNDFRVGGEVILISVQDKEKSTVLQENVYLWNMPKNIPGLEEPVSVHVQSVEAGADGSAMVTLKSDRLALFVVLTTRAQGRFSENAFSLYPMKSKVVFFLPLFPGQDALDLDLLKSSLRVEHLGCYMYPPSSSSSSSVPDTSVYTA